MGGYASLMRTLASEGLLSGPELEQHLGAARLRQAELATASSGSNVSSGAEGGGSAEGEASSECGGPSAVHVTWLCNKECVLHFQHIHNRVQARVQSSK
jgi:hypothetical protein